jgi:hypothetical protein
MDVGKERVQNAAALYKRLLSQLCACLYALNTNKILRQDPDFMKSSLLTALIDYRLEGEAPISTINYYPRKIS